MNKYLDGLETGQINLQGTLSDRIDIIITGDLCFNDRIHDLCLTNDFENIYGNAMSELKDKSISITNLECPLTERFDPIEKTGPNLIAHPNCIDAVRYAGFDVVTLANNHILDQGEEGLRDTLRICVGVGLKTVGAGENILEAMSPLLINTKSGKIAICNFAEREFSIATENSAGAAPLDPVKNYYQILKAKRKADIVIVIIHGGNEYCPLPSPRIIETYRFFADLGVTAIIAHHTHCSSGFEVYKGVPIFYGLGNFIFDGKNKPESWYEGFFVRLTINENKVRDINLLPYWQCEKSPGLRLMDERESEIFLKKIKKYSEIIRNHGSPNQEWVSFCGSQRTEYLGHLLASNILERKLFKIAPRLFFKKKKLVTLLNLFRCQAHRDAIIEIIKTEIGRKF